MKKIFWYIAFVSSGLVFLAYALFLLVFSPSRFSEYVGIDENVQDAKLKMEEIVANLQIENIKKGKRCCVVFGTLGGGENQKKKHQSKKNKKSNSKRK